MAGCSKFNPSLNERIQGRTMSDSQTAKHREG